MPIAITADLLHAADQIEQLTSLERSILLRRAAALIQGYYIRLGSAEALAGPCGITFDLTAMASGIDLFGIAAISEMMREAVVVIGMLQEQDDVFSAPVGHG